MNNIGMKQLLLLALSVKFGSCTKFYPREKENEILATLLDSKYDPHLRPWGTISEINRHPNYTAPLHVNVSMHILSISEVDDYKMEYSIQLYLRQQWYDERLSFARWDSGNIKYITLNEINRIWTPDLFFPNEKESNFHKVMMPNMLIRIYRSGDILYSARVSLTLSCPMNLKWLPMDAQVCSLDMESWSWNTDNLLFKWKELNPVSIAKNLMLPRLSLEKLFISTHDSKNTTEGFRLLKMDLVFKREFAFYLLWWYMPSIMLVVVSWISFWLDNSMMIARIILIAITLVAMGNHTSYINSSIPPVSYVKAIDVWTGMCLLFIFGALIESAFVSYLMHSTKCHNKMHRQQDKGQEEIHVVEMCQCDAMGHSRNGSRRWLARFFIHTEQIDITSRLIFPLAFLVFNFIYWFVCLIEWHTENLSGKAIPYST